MSQTRNRLFALSMAVLFIATTLASTGLVVYSIMEQNKADKALTDPSTNKKAGEKMLQGTQLANFTPVSSIPELKTEDTAPGNGETVQPHDTVTADYTGAVASTGIIFQSSLDSGSPVPFSLDQVIKGWTEGVPGMKVGGTRRLLIPAALAYGANPPANSGIPPNADLVFDVTIHKIGQ